MPPTQVVWVIVGVVALISLVFLSIFASFFTIWLQALLSRTPVRLVELTAMRLRKVDVRTIVLSRIRAAKAGIDISTAELETHYLAGGRVPNVVSALISAKNVEQDLTWEQVTQDDLNGQDVLEDLQRRYQEQRVRSNLAELLPTLEGLSARADSDLNPAGVVSLGGVPIEAVADEPRIAIGDHLVVTGVLVRVKRDEGLA